MTPEELSTVRRRILNMDFDTFCREVLEREPNPNDVWMCEKWDMFRRLCNVFGCISHEYLLNLLTPKES